MPARLRSLPAPDRLDGAYRPDPVALLAGGGPLTEPLARALRAQGWQVHLGAAPAGTQALDLVAYLAPARPASWASAAESLTEALLTAKDTQRLLEASAAEHRAAFVTVTSLDGTLGLSAVDSMGDAVVGGLPGLVKTLAIEAPALFCRAVDLAGEMDADRAVQLLLAELHDAEHGLTQVGYGSDGVRRTVTLGTSTRPAQRLATPGPQDVLVVTGGGRGVTASCAIGLAQRYQPRLLLLGRSELTDEPAWAHGVAVAQLRAACAGELRKQGGRPTPRDVERICRGLLAAREIRDTVAQIRAAGGQADYLAVDVTDAAAVAAALAPHRDRITGVVHGAGVLADQLVVDKQAKDVAAVLAAKLAGLASVLAAVPVANLRHVVLFSSVAGFFGNRGQSDYAMANEALNRISVWLKRALPQACVASLNWGAWAGGMVTPELAAMFAERGVPLIPLERGVQLFVDEFGRGEPVSVAGPTTPLSTATQLALPAGGLTVRRDLAAVAADPVTAHHMVAGNPVLPATAAIGAMLNVVNRLLPGRDGTLVRKFAVLKGVVFDGEYAGELRLRVTPGADEGAAAVLATDHTGRPRYRAEIVSGATLDEPLAGVLPGLDAGRPATAYTDGALFHGPALRGIERVLSDGQRLVLACRLPDAGMAGGGYHTDAYSPVLADLLLQAALVWVHRHLGAASLPTAVAEVQLHAPLPSGELFLVVVDGVTQHGATVRCTVTACTPQGQVLVRMRGVDVVTIAGLGEKFTQKLAS
jgi:hypothetical protein